MEENKSQIIIYQTESGETKLDVRFQDETVWLTQAQLSTLFNKGRTTITEHISNIFKEGELEENSVCRKFRHTAQDGKTYNANYYNLDASLPLMGMQSYDKGTNVKINKSEVNIAKNYLNEEEIKQFKRNRRRH